MNSSLFLMVWLCIRRELLWRSIDQGIPSWWHVDRVGKLLLEDANGDSPVSVEHVQEAASHRMLFFFNIREELGIVAASLQVHLVEVVVEVLRYCLQKVRGQLPALLYWVLDCVVVVEVVEEDFPLVTNRPLLVVLPIELQVQEIQRLNKLRGEA